MPNQRPLSKNLVDTDYPAHRVDLYRQVARDILVSGSGDERYVIAIFGPDLIGSLALAIDPYRQFVNGQNLVARLNDGPKVVRTRTVRTQPRRNRVENWVITTWSEGYYHDPNGGIFSYLYSGPDISTSKGTITGSDQDPLYGVIIDTTRRTRPVKQTQGEFEMFIPKLLSPSRNHSFMKTDSLVYNSVGNGQRTRVRSWTRSTSRGPEFRCTNATVQAVLPLIRARADANMQKHVYGMLDNVMPRHRTYDMYYQAAELRETSLTLRGTVEAWRSFERLIGTTMFRQLQQTRFRHLWRNPQLIQSYARSLGRSTGFHYDELLDLDRNAAAAFLTFKFGWESTWRAVVQFLPSVSAATRRVNYLIKRIGLDTSFRTKRVWYEDETNFPTLGAASFLKNEDVVASSPVKTGRRKCELRLMVNLKLQFPHLDIPRLRSELLRNSLGTYPSAGDLYNLIPWTWIVDWFGGLGDYITLMGTIANDPSLINYGFITYREESETTVTALGQFTTTISRNFDGNTTTEFVRERMNHVGIFRYVYQKRISIPSLTNVKTYWDSNLNPDQSAILGSLFATRNGSLARRDAS